MSNFKHEFIDNYKPAYTYINYVVSGEKILNDRVKYIKEFEKNPRKNWHLNTYEKCLQYETGKENKYIFHTIPNNIICIDTDSPDAYKNVLSFLDNNKLLNASSVLPSFSNINSEGKNNFCNHFYFSIKEKDIQRVNNILHEKRYINIKGCGFDIFHNTGGSGIGVVDSLETTYNNADVVYLSIKKLKGFLNIFIGDHPNINIDEKKLKQNNNTDTDIIYDNLDNRNDLPCEYSLEQQKNLFSLLPDRCFNDYALWFKLSYGVIYSKLDLNLWREINATKEGYNKKKK